MPVPSSGELKLRADIALEVDGSATGDNVSLGTLSDTVGFDAPDTMSEFYGYVSYIQPTISGTPSTSSVYDSNMYVTSPSFSNPSAGTVERGFYFGTSTTATNNTFYSVGNTTASSGTFSRQFTSLSGSTTYRIWAVIRDTQSPARFTEAVSSMKSQTTLATISISTGWGGAQNLGGSELAGNGSTSCNGTMSGNCGSSYNHPYYGWSGLSGGYSRSMTHSGAAAWESYSSAPNVTRYWAWRTDGTTVENRSNMSGSLGGCLSGYGGQTQSNHNWYSLPAGNSSTNRTLTGFTTSGVDYENWPNVGTQYVGGPNYCRREVSGSGSGSFSAYAYNFL